MLVKVGLSYYMEGEHRQGVSLTRVSAWGLELGGVRGDRVRVVVETAGRPLTLRKRGRAGLKSPAASWVAVPP